MSSRFVILHHRQDPGEHWDLMLESGEVLLTWQLLKDPTGDRPFPIPARRIGDHRRAYLTYEGPLSGNRGTVRRVDHGTFEFVEAEENGYLLRLVGSQLCGRFQLRRDGGAWSLAKAEPD